MAWDNHGCMPLTPDDLSFMPQLQRYAAAGVSVVALNVGFDGLEWSNTVRVLGAFRHWLSQHDDRYRLVGTRDDLERDDRRLGVFFDIEGGSALDGQLSMVGVYRDLGVRWMSIAYNRNNALGGGCQDEDTGLTVFGRAVITEMERVGMTVCCSHTGFRTTMDAMHHATRPVIFSHSNPAGVWAHKRNVRDEAIRACAATGGVVGINGIGLFLGENDIRPGTFARHVDYVAQLVGVDHVGLGLDYVFDSSELDDYVRSNPVLFPPEEGYAAGIRMLAPEQLGEVVDALVDLGYSAEDVRKVLGGNFRRVAMGTWPTR